METVATTTVSRGQIWTAAELLSVSEASRYLGIYREQVYKLMDDGRVPFIQIGGHRAIPLSELRAYQQRRQSKAT
jgi:excisionase family DNA binding protein